ncbi:FAD binding domain-containing protein [Hansschlegelia quercus]|uniref:Carbon monoxide dehydrogenase n=1 Tax=Hansschlegelia quercus TaxID=2528245 RepID=A0A4Q9GGS4_9HYPH|nr:FAD binding domain-containing protein [Hansschlegelia quercus]TBN52585.1 carbon monoxide dehydrogenase [Hansschlegelia quercus]
MKAARFDLVRPRDLAEALDLLSAPSGVVKVMAGGQSLGPMLNLRLVEPDLVVDISAIPELRRFERAGDTLVIGAGCTHADIEDGRVADAGPDLLARVASGIAYRAVRNRGTVGGSLAHADPAADWPTALLALGAEIELASREGRRRLPLGAFLTGALSTALHAGELILAIRIPQVSPSAGFGYVKHARKIGEFAHALGAALVDLDAQAGRAVMGAVDRPPIVFEDAGVLFGGRIGPDIGAFDRSVADEALKAAGVASEAARHVHVEILRRALAQAIDRAPSAARAAA